MIVISEVYVLSMLLVVADVVDSCSSSCLFCHFLFCVWCVFFFFCVVFFVFQAEDGIRDLVRSRGLGDVYKRQ